MLYCKRSRQIRLSDCIPYFSKGCLDQIFYLTQSFFGHGFKTEHKGRLGVGCTYKTPPVIKQNTDAVDVDNVVLAAGKIRSLSQPRQIFYYPDIQRVFRGWKRSWGHRTKVLIIFIPVWVNISRSRQQA